MGRNGLCNLLKISDRKTFLIFFLSGMKIEYFEDGNVFIMETYKEGKLHGPACWFLEGKENPSLFTQQNFFEGKRHGLCRWWHPNGSLWKEGEKKNLECFLFWSETILNLQSTTSTGRSAESAMSMTCKEGPLQSSFTKKEQFKVHKDSEKSNWSTFFPNLSLSFFLNIVHLYSFFSVPSRNFY